MRRSISSWLITCLVPAAETTFSSIMIEPMSSAPKARASWPIFLPCVTQLVWKWVTLSMKRRDTATVFRYSWAKVSGTAGHLGVLVLEGPGDEGREAARGVQREALVLQVADALHVLDARHQRLAHAVHHRRRGAQAVAVGLAVDVDPLLGRALGVGEHVLAHVVGEQLGAAAGDRHQAGGLEAADDVVEAHPLLLGDELDLRRREGVDVELGVLGADVAQQLLVPLDRQVGVDAALHEDAGAVEGEGLLDLLADLLEGEEVALGVAGLAVEGAEAAAVDADVGVVDVAIDVVGGDRGVVVAVADLLRGEAEVEQVAFEEQGVGVAGRDAAAGGGVGEDLLCRATGRR